MPATKQRASRVIEWFSALKQFLDQCSNLLRDQVPQFLDQVSDLLQNQVPRFLVVLTGAVTLLLLLWRLIRAQWQGP